jgi:hypothetical protein
MAKEIEAFSDQFSPTMREALKFSYRSKRAISIYTNKLLTLMTDASIEDQVVFKRALDLYALNRAKRYYANILTANLILEKLSLRPQKNVGCIAHHVHAKLAGIEAHENGLKAKLEVEKAGHSKCIVQ